MKLFFHWHTTSGKTSTVLFSSNICLQKEILQVGKSATSDWAAAAEMLFPSSKILGEVTGWVGICGTLSSHRREQRCRDGTESQMRKIFHLNPFFPLNKLVSAHWRLLKQVLPQELTPMWDIWKLQPHRMLNQSPLLTDHCAVLLYRWCLHDVEWPLGTTLTFQSLA